MTLELERLPLVGQVAESGAEDRIFDGLLLAGPLVVLAIVVLGRTLPTQVLAAGYITVFVARILLRFIR